MVLNKFLDQYLPSHLESAYNLNQSKGLETMRAKNFNVKLQHFANANANASARGSAIALPELCSGKL